MNGDQPQHTTPPQNYEQPVAYDAMGRPLYAHPPTPPAAAETPQVPSAQIVHMSRAIEPAKPEIPEEIKRRHEASVKQYPSLNLSEAEYIISEVRRHPIGLLLPIATSILLIILCVVAFAAYPFIKANATAPLPQTEVVDLALLGLGILFAIGGYISYYVYASNRFYLTNESVIQEIQTSLFAKNEQTVSLANIEDASYQQAGILQTMFNYGSIRLSTEGDETTYRFAYVTNPKKQIAILNNAVEAFKNGRPVSENDD